MAIILLLEYAETKKAFYKKPISSTIFNIYEVDILSSTYSYWLHNNIKKKKNDD